MKEDRHIQLKAIALKYAPVAAAHLQNWGTRIAISIGAAVLYIAVFVPASAQLGAGAAALALLPVVVAGWLLGRRAGLIAGLASIAVNTVLLHLIGFPGWNAIIRAGGGPGALVLVLIGFIAGAAGERVERLRIQAQALTQEQERLVAEIATRSKIETALQRQNDYMNALHQTTLALVNWLELASLLETIVAQATALTNTPHGYLYLVEPTTGALSLKVGIGDFQQYVGERLAPGTGLAGKVWQSAQLLVVANYAEWLGRATQFDRVAFRSVVGVPLTAGSEVLGVLGLAHRDVGRTFTDEEITLVQRFANLASLALENAQLYSAAQQELTERRHMEAALRASEQSYRDLFIPAQRQTQELALLDQIRSALARELDLATVIRIVVEAIAATFGYTQVSLYLRQGEILVLQHQVGYDHVISNIPISAGVSGRVVRTGVPVLLDDVQADSSFLGAIGGIVSEICVPLTDQDQIVGILNVESTHGVQLTTADLELMLAVSTHVNIAIGRARLYAAARESEALYRSVIAALSEGIVVQEADGHISTCNASAERILGLSAEQLRGRTSFDIDWAAVHEDGSRFPDATHPSMVTLRTGIPQTNVVMGIHRPDGALTWIAINTQPLFRPDCATPYAVVASFADITERKQLEQALRTQALRDPLTGLFNRRYLMEALERELARAERASTPVGVMMIDIDHFKRFNDTYGHAAGDVLLCELGQFLQLQVRKEDIICRYGGEEFTVILPGTSLADTQLRAEHLRVGVKRMRVVYERRQLEPITLSLGIAGFPDHGANSALLLRMADIGLYRAKAGGRDRVALGGADETDSHRN